jgi:hypothetical protein
MRIFLGILLALAMLFGIASFFLVDMLQAQMLAFLQQKNVPVTSFTVSHMTPTSVTLRDVNLGENHALTAKTITLAYRGGTSMQTVTVNIHAEGLSMRAAQHQKGWQLGGIERVWNAAAKSTDAKATQVSVQGSADITVSAQKQQVTGDITISQLEVVEKVRTIRARDVVITPDIDGGFGTLRIKGENIEILQAGKMLLAPMRLEGKAVRKQGSDSITHAATVKGVEVPLEVNMAGEHVLSSGAGKASIRTTELAFSPDGLTFAALLPALAEGVDTPPMKLQVSDEISYKNKETPLHRGMVNVLSMPVGSLMAQALGKGATMEGTLKGSVPFVFRSEEDWQLKNAALENDGPMKLTLLPVPEAVGGFVSTLSQILAKKDATAGALNEVNVSRMTLAANSTDNKGNMLLQGAVEGFNPLLKRPVKLHLNLTTNLHDLLRSMASVTAEKVIR